MKKLISTIFFLAFFVFDANAQTIQVNPTGVNVNSQNSTTAFLTFGRLNGYRPAEAVWCGELISAAPDLGLKCDPRTIYGSLPARYNFSRTSGNDGFTDIMSIPPSIVRRAYLAAVRGASAGFFYVRRFINANGGPDQFVNVTCRMTGGGARVPFALTDVKLSFDVGKPILFLKSGESFPNIKAEIRYNGTGRLKGRWEVVLPGQEPPSETDLLTEATLPIEERGKQKRYAQISRFNHFLSPNSKFTLPGPDPKQIPTTVEGQYQILLRIEATDDKEGDSDLTVIGVGPDTVHSGAIAGFPLPTLKYFVGGASNKTIANNNTPLTLVLSEPNENATMKADKPIDFIWQAIPHIAFYRLEITDTQDNRILSALLLSDRNNYRAPSWLKEKVGNKIVRWRVVALAQSGKVINESEWRGLRLER